MSRSTSNASVSIVALTVPSIAFSIGTTPEVEVALVDGEQHVGHRPERHQLAGREVGLAVQRLLGERAGRTEEPDPTGRRIGSVQSEMERGPGGVHPGHAIGGRSRRRSENR